MKFLGALVLGAALWAFSVWLLMITWNLVAAYFGFKLIGFGIAACIMALLGFVGRASR